MTPRATSNTLQRLGFALNHLEAIERTRHGRKDPKRVQRLKSALLHGTRQAKKAAAHEITTWQVQVVHDLAADILYKRQRRRAMRSAWLLAAVALAGAALVAFVLWNGGAI